MLCDECKNNPAVVHYVSIVNGVKTEHDLCEQCASILGMKSFSPFTWSDLFPHAVQSPAQQIRCSKCGMTMSEFKRHALLGCTSCYQELRSGIEPILRQVQKGLYHIGRTPIGHESAKLPRPGETIPQAPQISREDELTAQMHDAVSKEDFERAAQIRDEIKNLRHKGITSNTEGENISNE